MASPTRTMARSRRSTSRRNASLVSASSITRSTSGRSRKRGSVSDYAPNWPDRSGSVGQLDVSSDGRWLLFDQGKALQIRSVADGGMINTLQNPGGVIPFETLAQFSPDASLLLTAGAPEGRLQLWQTPTESARGYEVRQFAPREQAAGQLRRLRSDGRLQRRGQLRGLRQQRRPDLPLAVALAHVRGKSADPQRPREPHQRRTQPEHPPDQIGFKVPNPPTREHPKGRLESGRPVTIVIE